MVGKTQRRGLVVFFFNDTATTEIYTLSLHDALPISGGDHEQGIEHAADEGDQGRQGQGGARGAKRHQDAEEAHRSEEHTSELQSRQYLVCRLLLEKKKKQPEHKRLPFLPPTSLY